jgi:putative ABC transport system permease protein
MLKNYVTSALRNFRKHTGHSFINVTGLAVGIACCLGILMYVQDELSFDDFHADADHLYRLNKVVTPQEGGEERHAITSGLMGPTLVEDYPEAVAAVRVLPWFNPELTTVGETSVMLEDLMIADANFFQVFDFELVRGDPARVLAEPLSIVLTEETARRFFGDEDPVGRRIESLGGFEYTVTGIAKSAPHNSHLTYSAIISWQTTVPGVGPMDAEWLNNWLTQVLYTYVLLDDAASPASLEQKLPAFMERHFPERVDQYRLYLQPLSDIYLGSADLQYVRAVRTGNRTYVRIFSFIAVLVLLIACVNFMNLSTARAAERTREVGVRKALGARRGQLIEQYLGEAFVFVVTAVLLALALVQIALPLLNSLTGKSLGLGSIGFLPLSGMLAGLTLVCTMLAGTYPAFLLSRFRPEGALRAKGSIRLSGGSLRRVLVVLQFAATILLIVGTAVVYRQVRFSQQKDLGFDREQLLVLRTADTDLESGIETFRQELLENPAVLDAAVTGRVPGSGTIGFGILPEGKPDTETWTANAIRLGDTEMARTYGLEVVDGRFFDEDRPTDAETGVVINETLARQLGWEDPVGRSLSISGELSDGRVIGVVGDFHYESIHNAIGPLVLFVAPRPNYVTVRFRTDDVQGLLSDIESKWAAMDAVHPFDYTFLDQQWARMYVTEERLMQTLTLFAVLAVFVACLGLFGLAMHTSAQRTKEIGIRKVLGASVGGIVTLLSREFVLLVLAGGLLAVPLAWTASERWLEGFAYRIHPGPGIYILAILTALVVALVSVGWQAVRAATADPVSSLRYE